MKNLLTDAVGGAGLACLAAGIYLKYGAGEALMTVGAILAVVAVVASATRGR